MNVVDFFASAVSERTADRASRARESTRVRLPILCLLSSAIGIVAWTDPERLLALLWLLPLPMLIFRSASRTGAFLVAFSYYAVGANAVPGIIRDFFPGLSMSTTLLIWAGDAALLALPWALAFAPAGANTVRRAGGVLAALTMLSLPPIGLFHWGSPMMVAGLLFPGWQWLGLLITAGTLTLIAIAGKRTRAVHAFLFLAAILSIGANIAYIEPMPPPGWRAVSLESGRNPELWSDEMLAKRQDLADRALAEISLGAKVIIFPEASSGSSRRAQAAVWEQVSEEARANGATVLVGEETWNSARTGFRNALIGYGTEKDGGAVVVSSMVPMPMGDWKFGFGEGAETDLFGSGVIDLHGLKVAFSMCYEDFLLWPHRGLLSGRANLLVSATNQWPSSGTSAEIIQDTSRAALARMAGVAKLTAKNR